MANRLADMHEIAPQLTEAVAKRITSTDLHEKAPGDLGAFVHRTVVEDEHTYAVRIDDGSMLDAAFMLDLAHEQLGEVETAPAREEAYFAGARLDDDELRDAAAEDEQRRAQARARHTDATRSNLGLGHDIRAGLIDPTDAQLRALTQIVCRLLVRHYRELIAYAAGYLLHATFGPPA